MPSLDDDDFSTDLDYQDDTTSELSSEEEEWTLSARRQSKRPRSTTVPKTTSVKKRSKSQVYEGVTDSETEASEDENVSNTIISSIPFVQDKGHVLESILEYNEGLYLVKWKHRSYREATWLSKQDILSAHSSQATVRKMQNAVDRQANITEDDLEEDRERRLQYTEPERVVDMTKSGNDSWYLVKWKTLPYKECTWESESVLFPDHYILVDAHLSRSMVTRPATIKVDRRFHKLPSGDPLFTTADQQDRLRDYQVDGVNWLSFGFCQHRNLILADEMGLGKTIQAVVFLNTCWQRYHSFGPSLVVVPLSTIDAWSREFLKWAPNMNVVVYNGDAQSRRIIRHYEFKVNVLQVVLTTYELVLKDQVELQAIPFKHLIVDEGHRLKNSESQLYTVLDGLITCQHHRVLITGTPLQNSLRELWSLLHFLDRTKFPSFDDFNLRYAPESAPDTTSTRTTLLHQTIRPYLLRRVKKDVEQLLPAKREQILRVDLSPNQRDLYRLVLTKNYLELSKQNQQSRLVNILGELKKICNHPVCFTNASIPDSLQGLLAMSSKLSLLDMLMTRLVKDGHRLLLFSQSIKMLDILEQYLTLKGWPSLRIDGGVSSEERRRAIDAFNATDSPHRAFLLSTRAGGVGINLTSADTVVIYDSDWNPQNDLQAMARCHRIGQTRSVNIYRLVCSGTVEETILERAKEKMVLDHLVIGSNGPNGTSSDSLQAILKIGAQSLFSSQPQSPVPLDLDAILSRAEPTSSEPANDLLGQVADFGKLPSWDEIIPERERQVAEAEAAERELFAKEGALQEAIMTTSKARRARKINTVVDDKAMAAEAVLSGILPSGLDIEEYDDNHLIGRVKVGLIRSRVKLRTFIDRLFGECKSNVAFRLDVSVKSPNWSKPWTPRDDAMLLVAIHRHGFNWDTIMKDTELKLPFTLAKGTLPQSTHLQRRVEYLVSLLESHATSTPSDGKPSMKALLKPVRREIAFLNTMPADQMDGSVQRICEAVRVIGNHINRDIEKMYREEAWEAVAAIWPTNMTAQEVVQLYSKLA